MRSVPRWRLDDDADRAATFNVDSVVRIDIRALTIERRVCILVCLASTNASRTCLP